MAALAVMGAIICGAMAVFQVSASPRGEMERRLEHIVSNDGLGDPAVLAGGALRDQKTSLPTLKAFLDRRNLTEQISLALDRADMRLSVAEFVALRIFGAAMGLLLGLLIFGAGTLGMILMLVFGVIGYKVPVLILHFAQGKRLRKLNEQLSDALQMLSSSLKAGFGLMQGMDIVARELAHPMATELRRTIQDINIGSTMEEALLNLSHRCGSQDVDIVVTAMIIQQTTGGNLSEILDNVNHTMRERVRIRGEIKTLTTQQSMSGIIIGGMPVVVGGFITLTNPTYITPLFHDPIGIAMLSGAIVAESVGIFMIKKILAIEV